MEKKSSGFDIASIILAIFGIVLSFIPVLNLVSYIVCIIALIFAILALVKKYSKTIPIIAIVLCVLAFVIATIMNLVVTSAISEVTKNALDIVDKQIQDERNDFVDDAEIIIGEFKVISNDPVIANTELEVTVKNISDEPELFALRIDALDENNNVILSDMVYTNRLGVGEVQTLKAFEHVDQDKVEQLKSATFKAYELDD